MRKQELIVDLHVHSHFSRATSKQCNLEGLYRWGKLKGITVIGTGDFTHPQWFNEIREKLVPAEGGLYQLQPEIAQQIDALLPASVRGNSIWFVPTVEIATIYKKGDKVRKLHQLVILPNFEAVRELNTRLERIGNLNADGRPILGLDSKELLRHVLEVAPTGLYIPAHIWTPWFGMFGSKSGFDTIAEAYEELTPHITVIETGLSSDPFMNWRLNQLQNIAITSHSDAHSPQKLGREATVMHCAPTYSDVIEGIRSNDQRLLGTIEFFPEEGKYHADGHRLCNVRFTPAETKAHAGVCPQCNKGLVVGVDYRVNELANNPLPTTGKKQVEYIIPLAEVLAELRGVKTVSSKAVVEEYHNLIAHFGDEFSILRKVPLDDIRSFAPLVGLAIERLRRGNVHRDPGFDGVFGTIKVFKDAAERQETISQLLLT